jgi:hypothetical protein
MASRHDCLLYMSWYQSLEDCYKKEIRLKLMQWIISLIFITFNLYRFVTMVYLCICNNSGYYKLYSLYVKHSVSDTRFCACLQVVPTKLGGINSSTPNRFLVYFLILQTHYMFKNVSNRKPCAWQWTHLGTCRIRLSEGISKLQQLKKKSAATALNTELASAHIQMT